MTRKAQITVAGILDCEKFIKEKVAKRPMTSRELAESYVNERLQSRSYTEEEVADISANFGMAIATLTRSMQIYKRDGSDAFYPTSERIN